MLQAYLEREHIKAAEVIGKIVERPIMTREATGIRGGERAVEWIRTNPTRFARLLAEMEALVESWNGVARFSPDFDCCSALLKSALNGRELPPLIPQKGGLGPIRELYYTILSLGDGMRRGQEGGGESVYKFHLQDPPLRDEALVIGMLFHAYEIQVGTRDPKLTVQIKRYTRLKKNYILDPLVERVLTLMPTNPIFEAVVGNKQHGGLDWITGYEPFSARLRAAFVQKEGWSR